MRLRRPGRLGQSVLVVTALLVLGTLVFASWPPRPFRSVLTVVHAVSLQVATYWLVVVALVGVADRLADPDVAVTERTFRRLAAVVFAGALAVELSPLARVVVGPAAPLGGARIGARAVAAVQTALFPAALFLGTGLAVLALRDAAGERFESTTPPLAPRNGFEHGVVPAALWRLGRVLAGAAAMSAVLGAVGMLAVRSDPYVVLTVVEAGVEALGALADHLVVGVALVALFVYGVRARLLAGVAAGVVAGTFLLGLAVGIVGALLGVVVVSVTVTPIPAVESAALVDWPDPFAWRVLVLVGTVVAAGVGVRTIHGRLERRSPEPPRGPTNDSSDA